MGVNKMGHGEVPIGGPSMIYILDLIMKIFFKIVWHVILPMKLLEFNLDLLSFKYNTFTHNTRLQLVFGLVKNHNFHRTYLQNNNELELKILIQYTSICPLVITWKF